MARGPSFAGIEKRIKPVASITTPMRVALYGRAGSGKTTIAATFPAPLLVDIKQEEGTASVADVPGLQVFPAESWEDFEQVYWFLENGEHKFKTVILDTVTQLQELAIRQVLSKAKKSDEDAGGFGTMSKGQWGDVATLMKTWLMNFRNLGFNVVYLAQERVFNAGDDAPEDNQIAPEVGPRLMPSVGSTLNAAVDYIGQTFVREHIVRKRDPKTKKVEEMKSVQYCLRVGPHSYYTTKVRSIKSTKIPSFLVDATYEDLVELRAGDV